MKILEQKVFIPLALYVRGWWLDFLNTIVYKMAISSFLKCCEMKKINNRSRISARVHCAFMTSGTDRCCVSSKGQ